MVDALPFRGLRFDAEVCGAWGGLLGPPYDVVTPERAAALRALSRYQITHVETPGAGGAESAAATLRDWREAGALKRDAEPSYYVARHRFRQGGEDARADIAAGGGAAGAVVGGARGRRLDEAARMDDGRAPRGAHDAARHRARRRLAADGGRAGRLRGAGRGAGGAVAGRPAAAGIDPAGEEHALFVVDGEREVGAIRAALARETLYMADGHHRYESALGHREVRRRRAGITWAGDEPENFVLMGIVRAEDPGLIVGATHRLLHAPPPADALARLRATFEVETLGAGGDAGALMARVAAAPADRAPIGVHGLTDDDLLLLADDRTRAALPPELPASWAGLGPAVLQFGALGPAFGSTRRRCTPGGRCRTSTTRRWPVGPSRRGRRRPPSCCRRRRWGRSSRRPTRAIGCRRRAPTSCPSCRRGSCCTPSTRATTNCSDVRRSEWRAAALRLG